MFRSTDGGDTWLPSSSNLPQTDVQTVLIDRRDGTVYAAVFLTGVFRSTDGGETWSNSSQGLPRQAVFTIALDEQAGMFYVGTFDYGMYRSKDGAIWETTGMGLTNMKIHALLPGQTAG